MLAHNLEVTLKSIRERNNISYENRSCHSEEEDQKRSAKCSLLAVSFQNEAYLFSSLQEVAMKIIVMQGKSKVYERMKTDSH